MPVPAKTPHFPTFHHRLAGRVQRIIIGAGGVLGIILLVLTLSRPMPLVQLDSLGYDLLLRTLHKESAPCRIVIVDVDEKSLREVGQWPWPRYQIARLLELIHSAGVAAAAVDFVFAEPDRLSLVHLKERFRQDMKVTLNLDGIPGEKLDNDAILATALSHPDIVTGLWFDFSLPPASGRFLPPSLPKVVFSRTDTARDTIPLPKASGILPPTPALLSRNNMVGFLNSLPDHDGKIRRSPLLIEYQGEIYPSLALAAVMKTIGATQMVGMISAAGIEEVRVGDIRIPTDRSGNMLLPFRTDSSHRFERFSAADILQGKIPLDRLKNKIVFVGSSATAQNDVHPTALDRQFPGVMVHGVAADTLLRRDFISSPAWAPGAQFILVLVTCAVMALLLSRYPLIVCAAVCAGGVAGIGLGARLLLVHSGLFLSPVPSLMSLVGSFIILGVIRFRGEEKEAIVKTQELSAAQNCAIIGLISVAETRDPETGNHVVRTQIYVRVLAEQLARQPEFRRVLTPEQIEIIYKSAPLHDIGKVGVRDHILLKPGRLTEGEYDIMRQHTLIGQRALERADRLSGLDSRNSFLRCAEEIASAHHERWDGKGYPHGLKGTEIPLAARLMAVADVYDTIRSPRPYKEALPHEDAVRDIRAGSGTQFDPDVVEAFLRIEQDFLEISRQHADSAGHT